MTLINSFKMVSASVLLHTTYTGEVREERRKKRERKGGEEKEKGEEGGEGEREGERRGKGSK